MLKQDFRVLSCPKFFVRVGSTSSFDVVSSSQWLTLTSASSSPSRRFLFTCTNHTQASQSQPTTKTDPRKVSIQDNPSFKDATTPKPSRLPKSEEPDPFLDRYPAIKDLRKINFRIGHEPYKVYKGSLTERFRALKLFSISTSLGGVLIQPILLKSFLEAGYGIAIVGIAPIFFFTYVTPILIHFLSKRYVTELWYNPINDKYTKDVIISEVPGMFTTFLVKTSTNPEKTRPVFVKDSCFTQLEHYGRIMRFDEPIDLRLGDNDSNKSTKKKSK